MARQHTVNWPLLAGHCGASIPDMKLFDRLRTRDRHGTARWTTPVCLAAAACAALLQLLATLPAGAADEGATKPGTACEAAVRRQFDFWLGDWDVRDASGKLVGRNRITRVQGGCALEEQWSGNGGVTGSSINAYDVDRSRWHQTWVDNTGGLLLLEGGLRDGRMVMSGHAALAAGDAPASQRISWQALPDGRVRQLWESSADGTTWTVVFDGYYTRRPVTAMRGPVE
jgi:hypothetical protein